MKHWERTVDQITDQLAQSQLAEILTLAFSQLEQRAEVQEIARRYMQHRTHEHTKEITKYCECELCTIYRRIENLKQALHMYDSYTRYHDSDPTHMYSFAAKQLHGELHRLHNRRRELMGLPIKEHKPWKKVSLFSV